MNHLIALIIGFLIGWFFASRKYKREFVPNQNERKEENKRKILELLNTKHPLTNNDVEISLNISDATATRYFDELEKEGKVRHVGKTGRHVNYEKA